VTVLTYIFSAEDIREDGTIEHENKRMMLLIKEIDEKQFKDVVNLNYTVYPQFKYFGKKTIAIRVWKKPLI